MELQAIEKEKEYLEAKKLSKKSSKKSDKSNEIMQKGMRASQIRELDSASPDQKGNMQNL